MIRTRQLPDPSHEPHHLPGLDPPSLVVWFTPVEKYAQVKLDHFPRDRGKNKKYLKPPASFCNRWSYHVGIVRLHHEYLSVSHNLSTFFWFMSVVSPFPWSHLSCWHCKASRWFMKFWSQVCQQTFGEPSVMSNAPCWCCDWWAIPSKKKRHLYATMNNFCPNKFFE